MDVTIGEQGEEACQNVHTVFMDTGSYMHARIVNMLTPCILENATALTTAKSPASVTANGCSALSASDEGS